MRNKLEKLLDKAFLESDDNYGMPCTGQVADYLIENGIIALPCKVGDVVYCEYGEKIISGKVNLIRPFISENDIVFKGNIICELESPFYDDGRKEESELYVVFGRKWGIERVAYLTKEEAEQALKGDKDK